MLVNVNGVYYVCMYVNKRVQLAQWGIALQKMYVCIIMIIFKNALKKKKKRLVTHCESLWLSESSRERRLAL